MALRPSGGDGVHAPEGWRWGWATVVGGGAASGERERERWVGGRRRWREEVRDRWRERERGKSELSMALKSDLWKKKPATRAAHRPAAHLLCWPGLPLLPLSLMATVSSRPTGTQTPRPVPHLSWRRRRDGGDEKIKCERGEHIGTEIVPKNISFTPLMKLGNN